MKAWMVSEIDGDGSACIVFSKDKITARQEGASDLDLDTDQVICNRANKYDEYSEKGFVPTETLIQDGWWFECWNCSEHVDSGTEELFLSIKDVYCSYDCFLKRQEKIKKVNEEFEEFKTKVSKIKTKLTIIEFRGGWPTLTPSAKFTFPGGKHNGTIRLEKGELTAFVAKEDICTYYNFLEYSKLFEKEE